MINLTQLDVDKMISKIFKVSKPNYQRVCWLVIIGLEETSVIIHKSIYRNLDLDLNSGS